MPYIRVVRAQFDPAAADQIAGLAADVRGAFRQLPGIQQLHLALDRQGGAGLAVALFDTREHAGFTREALGEIVARLRAAGLRDEAAELYEVVA